MDTATSRCDRNVQHIKSLTCSTEAVSPSLRACCGLRSWSRLRLKPTQKRGHSPDFGGDGRNGITPQTLPLGHGAAHAVVEAAEADSSSFHSARAAGGGGGETLSPPLTRLETLLHRLKCSDPRLLLMLNVFTC
ncbi:hypothetical protein MHYP_G00254200 [Metynnis hypsauchen]